MFARGARGVVVGAAGSSSSSMSSGRSRSVCQSLRPPRPSRATVATTLTQALRPGSSSTSSSSRSSGSSSSLYSPFSSWQQQRTRSCIAIALGQQERQQQHEQLRARQCAGRGGGWRYQLSSTRCFSTEPVLENAANPPPPAGPIPTPTEEKGEGAPPEVSERVAKLSEDILSLNMLELGQLLKVLKHRLGLSDADLRGVAVAAPGAGGGAGGGAAAPVEEEKKEEKDIFDLKLLSYDDKSKIKVIKEVRSISGLGLKEAKELVEGAPKVIKKDVKKEEAEALLKKLQEVGAKVELI
ncbi:ribosomal protein l7 l12 [Nannochloropsis oceanica]